MNGATAGMWGLFGGFAIEGLEFYVSIRRLRCAPWQAPAPDEVEGVPEAGMWGYVVAEAVRLVIGAGLAWAAAATAQVSGPLGALGLGAAAPVVLEQIAKTVPLRAAPAAGPP